MSCNRLWFSCNGVMAGQMHHMGVVSRTKDVPSDQAPSFKESSLLDR